MRQRYPKNPDSKLPGIVLVICTLFALGVLAMMLTGNSDLLLCGHHYVNGHC